MELNFEKQTFLKALNNENARGEEVIVLDLLSYSKVKESIQYIQEYCPAEGYYLAFSGGKDSIVLKALADMAGVKYDAHMNLTTVDPLEVLNFIRHYHPDVHLDKPPITMWQAIIQHGCPPTQLMRYCCMEIKEVGGIGRIVLTGIRAEESPRRAKRQLIETCYTHTKQYVNPILNWTKEDIWEFISDNKLPYCSLYDEGFKRIGCVLCPMHSRKFRIYETQRFPKFYNAYLHTFGRLLALKPDRTWKTPQEVMDWWIYRPEKYSQTLFKDENAKYS
jgi:phosphoadenosine phosphosulfate reductase